MKTYIEKHKEIPFDKKGIIFGLIFSVIIVGVARHYVVPEIVRVRKVASVTITALGKKNEKSQGYEVWLKAIKNNGSTDLNSMPLDSGWNVKDNKLYAGDKFPATLHLSLDYVAANASLVFLKHGWSGMVQVTNGKQQNVIDLYADPEAEYICPLDVSQATVVNYSVASHVSGYILSFLFYVALFYFLFLEIMNKRRLV